MSFSFAENWSLPRHWEITSIGELTFDWKGGASLKPEDFRDEGFPILHKGAIQRNGKIEIDSKKKTFAPNEFAKSCPTSIVNKSYLAVTLRDLVPSGPSIGLIANLKNSTAQEFLLAQGAYGFCVDEKRVDGNYLVWLSNYEPFRQYIKRYAVGSTQIHIRTPIFQGVKIPLPPLDEQKRIAAVLDKADEVRAKRRAALEKLDSLLQSVFLDMFGDPVSNPKGWNTKTFGEIVSSTKLGLVKASSETSYEFEFPYVRMNAITRTGELDLTNVFRVNATQSEVSEFNLSKGDFLFNTRNSKELVGKTAIFHSDGTYLFNNNILRVRFKPDFSSYFVHRLFQSEKIQRELEARKSGTTSVFAIYYKNLQSVPVLCPPSELQKKYEMTALKLEDNKSVYKKSGEQINTLFQSLQQRAFVGELFGADKLASRANSKNSI